MNAPARFRVGSAVLSRKALRWRRSGHPWVFRDDLVSLEDVPTHVVAVRDEDGREHGIAASSTRSKIGLRFVEDAATLTRDRERWFAERIDEAIARRATLDDTNAYRVVAADGDGIPGLIVDRYGDVLVLQALIPFVDAQLDLIVPALVERFEPRMLLARNDLRVRGLEGLEAGVELLHGRRVREVEYFDADLRFVARPWDGQKTGAFLDQRPARRLARSLAAGQEVLDLCCYQGAFALHCARGGAAAILAIDASQSAIDAARVSAERNAIRTVEFRRGKVAPQLAALVEEGRKFCLVVLDPPAFAKSRAELEAATRGYIELNAKAMRTVAPGGHFLTCSCSYAMRAEAFRKLLGEAARRAGRRFIDRGRVQPALDHPVLLGLPEADYLQVQHLEAQA